MRVARYWAYAETSATAPDGERVHRSLWRGSDLSEADAKAAADRALADVAATVRAGTAKDWYAYAESTRPEPLVDEVMSADGTRAAAVTINRYGATILNTARVPFVDVDLVRNRTGGGLGRFFGKKPPAPDPAAEQIAKLETWVGERSGRAARVYRTAAGLRYLLPATELDPASDETRSLLERLGTDPRYTNLCRVQRCYRARLSPKPWRLGVGGPPGHIKYGRDAAQFAEWDEAYREASMRHAVCDLLTTIGAAPPTDDAARVLDLHDAATGVGSGLPLA